MFNQYLIDKKEMAIRTEMPYFCEKYFGDSQKKCKGFYDRIASETVMDGVHQCPYGFSCYKCNGKIYSGLIITDHCDLSKVTKHLKDYKQTLKDFSNYRLTQIRSIIGRYDELEKRQKILELTIHDLKNAAKHFMDLADSVKQNAELSKKIESDDELFSAIEGYSLIQYRLDYHDQLLNNGLLQPHEKRNINFHKMFMKLSKLMKYRGIKKDVAIEFHGHTSNIFLCNRDMYLASFIFIENAIKYAAQFSRIDISFKDIGTSVTTVEIKNVSKNISNEEMQCIYNDGFRSLQAQSTSKGSGLGLGLAKKICERSGVDLTTSFKIMNQENGVFIVDLNVKKDLVEGA